MDFGRRGRRESPTIKCIIVFMGPFSLVRCGKYRTLISISRSFVASNFLKPMGFGREWRRESPTIKCNRKSVCRL
ncbi:hypothetical protein Peur_062759 [Populus x canadensis]